MSTVRVFLSKPLPLLLFLAIGHGLNDFVAGYLLGNLLHLKVPVLQASLCFLVYNGLAFGGQYFAARWLSVFHNPRRAYCLTWLLNLTAVVCFFFFPPLSFVFAGCASALYHVIGGSWAAKEVKALSIGIFAAPGIVGLALAGYMAFFQLHFWPVLTLLVIVFLLLGLLLPSEKLTANVQEEKRVFHFDGHDSLMLVLLSIITMRSALWNVFQVLNQHHYSWLLPIALSACVGKIAGGYISDRIGWRVYNLLSLALSAPLVSFFKHDLILFCIGIALLQSGIPATTALLLQSVNKQREKGVALSFGVAVFMAGIISILMIRVETMLSLCIYFALSLLLSYFLFVRKVLMKKMMSALLLRLQAPAKRIVLKSR